jgi:transcriptional regulator with XRE-family HTH domain
MHPEERRIAGLLRELIVQNGAPLETLESRLGWEPGHLSSLLEGKRRLNFEDTLEILPLLGTTPTDFFAWLYGFEGKESVRETEEELVVAAGGSLAQRALDHRFDQSLRVVKAAIARRQAWKDERARI